MNICRGLRILLSAQFRLDLRVTSPPPPPHFSPPPFSRLRFHLPAFLTQREAVQLHTNKRKNALIKNEIQFGNLKFSELLTSSPRLE